MSIDDKRQNIWPTFYIYEEADGWKRTDDALTKEINGHVFLGRDFQTNGRSFYPQWPEPEFKSERRQAWLLDANGEVRARWYFKEVDHTKHHHRCDKIGQGRCRIQVPLKLSYDPQKKFWTKCPDPDAGEPTK